ncbi:MAG: sugar kinase [Anaerolineae bacterium]|nr:sugar kinase [Anaerolineae bacterium]
MWRLSPPGQERLEQTNTLNIHIGGAESNLASALARLGKRVMWWSRLPENSLGRHVANMLRSHQVDVSGVRWSTGRLGTYFVEFAPAPRATQVIYDRAYSAASQMQPDDFDWELLKEARWLHLTGITPALSHSCLETVRRAIQEAKTAGTVISFDLNYREKLWTTEQASSVLDELAAQCNLVIGAKRDIQTLFQISGERDVVLHKLHERWNGSTIVMTAGGEGASAYDGKTIYHADVFTVPNPIRIGAGDAFDTGLLYALMEGKPLSEALIYGNAVAALKLTIPGDIALITRQELDTFLRNQSTDVAR